MIGHLTLPALGSAHRGLAGALAVQLVAEPDHADGSVPVTETVLAALPVGGSEVPVKRFAGVAGPPSHGLLTLTELALGHVGTAAHGKEVVGDSVRVAVALLAQGVVESLRGALVTLVPNEV